MGSAVRRHIVRSYVSSYACAGVRAFGWRGPGARRDAGGVPHPDGAGPARCEQPNPGERWQLEDRQQCAVVRRRGVIIHGDL